MKIHPDLFPYAANSWLTLLLTRPDRKPLANPFRFPYIFPSHFLTVYGRYGYLFAGNNSASVTIVRVRKCEILQIAINHKCDLFASKNFMTIIEVLQ